MEINNIANLNNYSVNDGYSINPIDLTAASIIPGFLINFDKKEGLKALTELQSKFPPGSSEYQGLEAAIERLTNSQKLPATQGEFIIDYALPFLTDEQLQSVKTYIENMQDGNIPIMMARNLDIEEELRASLTKVNAELARRDPSKVPIEKDDIISPMDLYGGINAPKLT